MWVLDVHVSTCCWRRERKNPAFLHLFVLWSHFCCTMPTTQTALPLFCRLHFNRACLSTCHCGKNMTEVAQVAAVVAQDIDDFANEDEHNISDAEHKEDDMTHEEEDDEDKEVEEKSEETSRVEDKEPRHANDEGSNETDETHVNGVEHKDDTANEKEEGSDTVNGVAQDGKTMEDEEPDANEDQTISDLALKKKVSVQDNT